MNLPEQYLKEMQNLLGAEYDGWLRAMEEPAVTGLRTNDLKTGSEDFPDLFAVSGITERPERIPWIHNGFFTEDCY